METPNGNPIDSILPGLPKLQHRDSVIVMFRSGVDPHQVQHILHYHFYTVSADSGEDPNFAVGRSMHYGKMPALADVTRSLDTLRDHPGVIKPEYQADEAAVVPVDGYMPFIALNIMPFQQSRLSVLEAYTPNIYIVTAGVDHLMFERYGALRAVAKTIRYPFKEEGTFPVAVGPGRLHTGSSILNEYVGKGLPLRKTSLWMALSHNYKTGMLLSMAANVPLFNRGFDGKTKGVLIVSTENDWQVTITHLYQQVKYLCEGAVIPWGATTPAEHCEAYVKGIFNDRGWSLHFMEVKPGLLTGQTLDTYIEVCIPSHVKLELVVVDHLTLHGRAETRTTPPSHTLRDLNAVRDRRGFHLAVSDELPQSSKQVLRKAPTGQQWLAEVAVEGQYDLELAKEADQVFLMHILRDSGSPELMVKPAGFLAGKPPFTLPLTDVGGYTHERG
jgi:hypothetical protein